MTTDILIIDDEQDIRGLIEGILEDEGYQTRAAASDKEAYKALEEKIPSLIILDIWLQGSQDDGLKILENIIEKYDYVPVLMISGHGTIETAVSAIKIGAYDFIEKPFKTDRLLLMIERALETAQLKKENKHLKSRQSALKPRLIGASAMMNSLKTTLDKVAQTNSRVLITGEQGSGKDIAARYIHQKSKRADEPYMILNCATLRPERLEIELFGSENGVNGEAGIIGVLEQAHNGTLLLDEVADMPLETQGKILRVLQEQKFQRVGGQEEITADVRIIASTNKNLENSIEEGLFRKDLYYRLNVVPINIPPLKAHLEDIPILTEYFCTEFKKQVNSQVIDFDDSAIAVMQSYSWPGNIRQLRNVVEWCLIMASAKETSIKAHNLPPELSETETLENAGAQADVNIISLPLREAREHFEINYLESQIKRFSGNISKTADFVGMERSALHRKMKQLGISPLSKNSDSADNENEESIEKADSKKQKANRERA